MRNVFQLEIRLQTDPFEQSCEGLLNLNNFKFEMPDTSIEYIEGRASEDIGFANEKLRH